MSTATTNPSTPAPQAPKPTRDARPAEGRPQPAWLTVMIREVTMTVRRRSFQIATILTSLVIAGAVVAVSFFSGHTQSETVAVNGPQAAAVVEAAGQSAKASGAKVEFAVVQSQVPLDSVRDGSASLALVEATDGGGWTLAGNTSIDKGAQNLLTQAVQATTVEQRAEAAGTDWAKLTAGTEVRTELLNGDSERAAMSMAVGYVFSMLFYLSALMFGMPIATSIVEEKSSRVVEILAAAIPLRSLLAGKIAATTVLAVLQLSLYVSVGLIALSVTPSDLGFVNVIFSTAGWFLVFFLAGFLILAGAFAAVGAMCARAEDVQPVQTPVTVLLMASLFIGLLAKGTLLAVASFVPVVSSVAMPVRMLQGDVPLWQTLLSLAITLATAYLVMRLGARIYRRAVLHTGGRLSWREAMSLRA